MSASDAIHPTAQLGDANVAAGVQAGPLTVVGPGAVLEAGCRLGASVCVGARAVIGADAVVGDGAVVAPDVRVGAGAHIGPGAVVTRQVPPRARVQGHVATITGYVDAPEHLSLPAAARPPGGRIDSKVRGVSLYHLHEVQDMRGDLCVAEYGRDLPFVARRSFLIYNVPNAEIRGEHAHLRCAQFLLAVQGGVSVVVDDGVQREEFRLDRPSLGLYLPPMTWGIQYRYSEHAALLVLASDPYDPQDYIRDYGEFCRLVQQKGQGTQGDPPAGDRA